MADQNIVKFGQKSFCIISAKWNSDRQMGEIKFEDDNGIQYKTESFGMLPSEQRQAVFDAVKDAWIDAQAKDIGKTAEKLTTTSGPDFLRELAIACGNVPYEDYP